MNSMLYDMQVELKKRQTQLSFLMNFPGVNSATFIEDIFLLTQTRLHQQPLYLSALLKASVSQLCIKKNKTKKRSSDENSCESEIKAGCKALMKFCLKSHFTD